MDIERLAKIGREKFQFEGEQLWTFVRECLKQEDREKEERRLARKKQEKLLDTEKARLDREWLLRKEELRLKTQKVECMEREFRKLVSSNNIFESCVLDVEDEEEVNNDIKIKQETNMYDNYWWGKP